MSRNRFGIDVPVRLSLRGICTGGSKLRVPRPAAQPFRNYRVIAKGLEDILMATATPLNLYSFGAYSSVLTQVQGVAPPDVALVRACVGSR